MQIANIYDNGPLSPIVRIKENLSVWTRGKWEHYNVIFEEPIPRSSPMVAELVTLSGATTLAAAGTVAKQLIAFLQLNEGEFLHLRWEPLDALIEGVLWEQPGTARLTTRAVHARVSSNTWLRDPYLASTTFFILGRDRNMNLEARNLSPAYASPTARFAFFGYRYLVTPIPENINELTVDQRTKLSQGDKKTVEQLIGNTTWLPAEGRGA